MAINYLKKITHDIRCEINNCKSWPTWYSKITELYLCRFHKKEEQKEYENERKKI